MAERLPAPPRARRGLVAGGVLGAVAVGVAAGLAVERRVVGRPRRRPDPNAREPFGRLAGRERTVRATDGVPLHVEEVGSGPLTVVFSHGFALSLAAWHYQRRDLADVGRLVFYDHRSHGQSGRASRDSCTVEQLGRDLATVIDAVAPTGPVALVGHSLGGMTIMSLARQRPELFGSRVVGVALVGTSAGGVGETLVRLPVRLMGLLTGRVLPHAVRLAERNAQFVERTRAVGSDLAFVITRGRGFGPHASPSQVEFVERMIAATPIEVITAFTPSIVAHAEYEALGTIARVPTFVLAGDHDRVTPVEHSREIAARIPGADLVVLAGAGHCVMLERAPLVNLHLRAFLRRVAHGRRTPSASRLA
ncbi:MAG: alpha/beta hydrolase [Frankia sp.]|nr:alpha/beta hydrolase [Frankia sp.]